MCKHPISWAVRLSLRLYSINRLRHCIVRQCFLDEYTLSLVLCSKSSVLLKNWLPSLVSIQLSPLIPFLSKPKAATLKCLASIEGWYFQEDGPLWTSSVIFNSQKRRRRDPLIAFRDTSTTYLLTILTAFHQCWVPLPHMSSVDSFSN